MKRQLLFIFLGLFISFNTIGQVTTVGLIGSATANGWDSDIDMIQDANDTCLWTLDVTLTNGEVKFRANDGWDINWGSTDFPSGTGTQGGSNIPVFAGDYSITFNSCTGEYNFSVHSPIGIIGDATPGGWNEDTNMFKDTTENGFFIDIDLVTGGAKFRKDDDWTVNWGSSDFPSGTGTQGGDNIPIPKAGKYHVTLDTLSGEYNFEEIVQFENISIIGSAVTGVDSTGWKTDIDLTQNADNPDLWEGNVTLFDGELQFRANHDWVINWGGADFPIDTAVLKGNNIVAVAGNYHVTFNTKTLYYEFLELVKYDNIGLIGDAVSGVTGDWQETDLFPADEDSTIWKADLELFDGEAKFRANHDWTVNWGSGDFPTGTGVQGGANIPVAAGKYHVSFNSLTGEYSFDIFVVYDEISLVGKDGPFGRWPDETSDFDYFLTQSDDDDQVWTGAGISLTEADSTVEGSGIKFRANHDWAVNWGAVDFPSGTGTQGGANILCQEGTWDVTLNSATGEYIFVRSSAVIDLKDSRIIGVYPNPAVDNLNIDLSKLDARGDILVNVYEMNGKLLISKQMDATDILRLNVSELKNGSYFVRLSNHKFMIGKKFSILK